MQRHILGKWRRKNTLNVDDWDENAILLCQLEHPQHKNHPQQNCGVTSGKSKPSMFGNAVLYKNLWLKAVLPPQKYQKYPTPWDTHVYTLSWCPSLLGFRELRADLEAKSALHHFPCLSLGILVQSRNWNHQLHLSSRGDRGVTVQFHGLLSFLHVLPIGVLLSLGIPIPQDCVMACAMCRFRYFMCQWAQASISIILCFYIILKNFILPLSSEFFSSLKWNIFVFYSLISVQYNKVNLFLPFLFSPQSNGNEYY